MTLIEMEGFLRGKCLPGDILVGETNAQYLHRQLTTYEATVTNLSAQVQGLAAENADLKHPGTYLPSKRETPITDAVLAEILAQGVDLAIEHLTKKFEGTGGVGVPVMALEHLASELRKEQGK